MKTLKHWSLHQQLEHHVELTVDGQHTLCLYVLEENLFRVLLKRQGQLALDRTRSIAPQQDVPWEGRARDDLSGLCLPAWQLTREGAYTDYRPPASCASPFTSRCGWSGAIATRPANGSRLPMTVRPAPIWRMPTATASPII